MALYVGENSFSQLQKADSLTKAMLDGWTTESSDNPSIQSSAPIFGISSRNEVGREQYKENSWLFNGKRRRR